jgi:hypothetical protein
MRILALDLSKRSTGWACWSPGDQHVASGTCVLGSEYTAKGRTFANLHEELSGLNKMGRIDALFYEAPLNLGPGAGNTTAETINVLIGLAMHVESWGDAMNCRIIRAVNQTTWRREFLGPMKRGTKSMDLKDYAMERCRQLGFAPSKHDQAEAIGILTYACQSLDIAAPWVVNEILRPPLRRYLA